jgi:hypothetical protein
MAISWEIGELADGMRVVTTPVSTSQSVSVNVFVGAGSRGELHRHRAHQGLGQLTPLAFHQECA